MKFSIVIPLYNKENHIQRAINSVLNQTLPDFELIIVDDGSTDRSFEMANTIQDPRIRIIRQENRGVSAARNHGIMEAKHDWLAFLDADDEWMSDYLDMMITLHDNFPICGVLASGHLCKDLGGFIYEQYQRIPYPENWSGVIRDYYADLCVIQPFCSSSITVKKSKLVEIGCFPKGVTHGEDTDTWIRLFQVTDFAYIKKVGAIYHLNADNRSILTAVPDRIVVVESVLQLLKSTNAPVKAHQSLIDLLARHSFPLVREILKENNRKKALKCLWSFRKTKVYKEKWLKYLLASCFPFLSINLDG